MAEISMAVKRLRPFDSNGMRSIKTAIGQILSVTLLVVYVSFFLFPSMSLAKRINDFSLKNIHDGKSFNIADNRSKGLLLVFGSMYCNLCMKLLPVLSKLYGNHQSSGFMVVMVNYDKSADERILKKFVSENNIRFPFLIDPDRITKQNNIFALPTMLLVDRNGYIVEKFLGHQPYYVLANKIKALKVNSKGDQK